MSQPKPKPRCQVRGLLTWPPALGKGRLPWPEPLRDMSLSLEPPCKVGIGTIRILKVGSSKPQNREGEMPSQPHRALRASQLRASCSLAWGPGASGLTCDVEQLCGSHLSQMAEGRLLGAVRRTKHWVSEGLLVISQTISPGGLPSRLCAVLSANSCPCLLLSSLRHLWPLQLRQHPSSEHRGWRVDDVSSSMPVLPGGLWGMWISGRRADLHLLITTLFCSASLILIRARAGGRPPRLCWCRAEVTHFLRVY